MTAAFYSCRAFGSSFTITKFDSDFNVESSYQLSTTECTCPQGHKPTCRHRKMLGKFIQFKHISDGWFLNWDTGQWHQPIHEALPAPPEDDPSMTPQDSETASVEEAVSPREARSQLREETAEHIDSSAAQAASAGEGSGCFPLTPAPGPEVRVAPASGPASYEGDELVPATLTAETVSSSSANGRGQPSPRQFRRRI